MSSAKESRQARRFREHEARKHEHGESNDACPICGEPTKYIRGLYTSAKELEDLVKQGIFEPDGEDGFLVDLNRLKQWRKERKGAST